MLLQFYRALCRVQTHNDTHLNSCTSDKNTLPVKRATTMDFLKERRLSSESTTSNATSNPTTGGALKKPAAPFSFFLDTNPAYLDEEGIELSYFVDDSPAAEGDMEHWLERLDSLEASEAEAETDVHRGRSRNRR